MKIVYDHPDDIDLIVGAVAEVPAEDSILGPTLRCIIGEQMLRTKNGDRFFYDIVGKPHSFKESKCSPLILFLLKLHLITNNIFIFFLRPNQ